ncbi:MAG: hypothetical protein KBS68_04475 [Clostridiales bacterium]|nr:hypothetical protein [Candidatus Crickella merdequi]
MMEKEKTSFEEVVLKEKRRIIRELKKAKISDHKMKIIEPIVINSAWMRVKLDEAREQVSKESIVVEYDNGGGQKGIRKNPFFDAYEALFKSYMLGMDRILDCLPDRKDAEITLSIPDVQPQSVLGQIREKRARTP